MWDSPLITSIKVDVTWEDIRVTLENLFQTPLTLSQCIEIENTSEFFLDGIEETLEEFIHIECQKLLIEWILDAKKGKNLKQILEPQISDNIKEEFQELLPSEGYDDCEQYDLIKARSFEFYLIMEKIKLSYFNFPESKTFIQQLIQGHYPKTDFFKINDHEWHLFLDQIDYLAKLLDIFFTYYSRLMPTMYRNRLEVKKARNNLYNIAIVFSEIVQEYEEAKNMKIESFGFELLKEIARKTKSRVWQKNS